MKQLNIYLTILLFFFSLAVSSQSFTPGNIVVCRIGNGTAILDQNASPVFLDEYTPSGILVRSIAMPTAQNGTNRALTLSGASPAQTGMITLSGDGQYIVLAGYNAPVGTISLSFTNPNTVSRVIGLVNYNSLVNTSTALNVVSDFQGFTSATSSNGIDIWSAGLGSISTRGVFYTTLGSTTATQLTNVSSARVINISGGQLYTSRSNQIHTVGNGLPTTSGQVTTSLNLPTSGVTLQYVFADLNSNIPGVDVLYLADEFTGILKFSLVGGVWISNGAIGTDTDDYRGLAAKISGNTVTLFATRIGANSSAIGGGELVQLQDNSGYNGTLTGSPVVLATTSLDMASFRGVAIAPVQAPSCTVTGTMSATNITPTSADIKWDAVNGAVGYQYALSTSPTAPSAGTFTSSTSYAATGLVQGQTYYFHVRTDCGNFNTSTWKTISFVPACTAPPLPIVSNIGYTAELKWNTVFGASGYEYAVTTSSTPPSSGTATADTSFVATGLASVSQYYVHVRSDCGAGGFSPWTSKAFATSCLNPIVTVTANEDTRQFKWNTVKGTTGYEYALTTYRHPPVGGTSTEDTTVQFSRLNAGTTYYFHVRTACAKNGSASPWTSVPFQTTGLDAYPNPVGNTLSLRLYGMTGTGDVLISDAMGRVVKRVLMTNSSVDVPVLDLTPGVYLVRYSDGTNKYTVKVLKK